MSCWLSKMRFQQFALGAVPRGDLLPDLPVQCPEVLLHLAEVGEQVLGQGGQLLEVVQGLRGGHDPDVAVPDPLHLRVDAVALPLELGQAYFRVRLRLLDQGLQDREDAGQPRLRGHEVPAAQAFHPVHHVLRRGGEIVARLVLAGHIVFAQPGPFRGGPLVQVLRRRAGELVLAQAVPQAEQDVVEVVDQLLAADVPLVGPGEGLDEEGDGQRGVLRAQQRPSRVVVTQRTDCVVVHRVLGVLRCVADGQGRRYRRPHPPCGGEVADLILVLTAQESGCRAPTLTEPAGVTYSRRRRSILAC